LLAGDNQWTGSQNYYTYNGTSYFSIQLDNISSTPIITSTGGFNAGSDYRIKQDIHKISKEIIVDKLNPVTYKNIVTGKQDMGFIAHEVQEHFPYLVSGEKDGPINQSINYTGFIALLTKEIQELKNRVLVLEEISNIFKSDNTITFDNSVKTTMS
jgi:hypothetical protein